MIDHSRDKDKRDTKRRRARFFSFVALLLIVLATYRWWLPLPGTFLLVKDNLQKADCIVPLWGESYFRYKKAAELYKQGFAKAIVVSVVPDRQKELQEFYGFSYLIFGLKGVTQKEIVSRALGYFNIDPRVVYYTNDEVTSTFDEAVAARNYLLQKRYTSLILVTDTYHMRRALLIFDLVFRGTGIRIYHCTAVNALFDPHHWWRRESDAKVILLEYISIAHNMFYHFVLGKGRTAFDYE